MVRGRGVHEHRGGTCGGNRSPLPGVLNCGPLFAKRSKVIGGGLSTA